MSKFMGCMQGPLVQNRAFGLSLKHEADKYQSQRIALLSTLSVATLLPYGLNRKYNNT